MALSLKSIPGHGADSNKRTKSQANFKKREGFRETLPTKPWQEVKNVNSETVSPNFIRDSKRVGDLYDQFFEHRAPFGRSSDNRSFMNAWCEVLGLQSS